MSKDTHTLKKRPKRLIPIILIVATVLGIVVAAVVIKQITTTPRGTVAHAGELKIKEWGVTLPLAASIDDAFYTFDSANDEAYVSTKRLEQLLAHIQGCTAGLHGIHYKKNASGTLPLQEQHGIELLCAVPANDDTAKIAEIQSEIRAAVQSATAASSKPPDQQDITIEGEYVCLPHKTTTGPQTSECAHGLKTSDGIYYGLRDSHQDYSLISKMSFGKRSKVSGKFVKQESSIYPMVGIIILTSVDSIE